MKWLCLISSLVLVVSQPGTYCGVSRSCTNNGQCVDSINSPNINGICCGGTCLAGRPAADLGQFCNDTDPCGGQCLTNPSYALRCGPANTCILSQLGNHCNCTGNGDCTSGQCTNGKCEARGGTLANGAACITNAECASNNCTGGVCVAQIQGGACITTAGCSTGLYCFRMPGGQQQCNPLCPTNQTNCCPNGGQGAQFCATSGDLCTGNTCTSRPGLGQQCGGGLTCATTLLCDRDCSSGTACVNPNVCQNPNVIAIGNACNSNNQCTTGTYCYNNNNTCQPLPKLGEQCGGGGQNCADNTQVCAQTCNPVCNAPDVCQVPATIAIGSYCDQSPQCVSSGLCLDNQTSSRVCVARGSIAEGQWCAASVIGSGAASPTCQGYNSSDPQHVSCAHQPGTFIGPAICIRQGTIPNGALCDTSVQCVEGLCNNHPPNATNICIDTNAVGDGGRCDYDQECTSGICADASATNTTQICKPATVPANGTCVDSRECADYTASYARCVNSMCIVYLGRQCNSDAGGPNDQCGDTAPPNRNQALYCACNSRCTLIPASPTPAPIRNNCTSRDTAWNDISPPGFQFPRDLYKLSGSNLSTFLDHQCCNECDNTRYTLAMVLGYVVDCTALTINTYQSVCDPSSAPRAYNSCPVYPQRGSSVVDDGGGPSDTGGLSGGEIAGIVIGVLIGIPLLILLLYCAWKKYENYTPPPKKEKPPKQPKEPKSPKETNKPQDTRKETVEGPNLIRGPDGIWRPA